MTRGAATALVCALFLTSLGIAAPVRAQDEARAEEASQAEKAAPSPAEAKPSPPRRRPPQRRAVRRQRSPAASDSSSAYVPPRPSVPAPEIAPMPNRDIEEPMIRGRNDGKPSFSPTIIEPRDLPGGGLNRGGNDRLTREDRLFREPAPGATLRVPFSY